MRSVSCSQVISRLKMIVGTFCWRATFVAMFSANEVLPIPGAGGQNNQVRAAQPGQDRVKIVEPVGIPANLSRSAPLSFCIVSMTSRMDSRIVFDARLSRPERIS